MNRLHLRKSDAAAQCDVTPPFLAEIGKSRIFSAVAAGLSRRDAIFVRGQIGPTS
jgi:hypothetical protein